MSCFRFSFCYVQLLSFIIMYIPTSKTAKDKLRGSMSNPYEQGICQDFQFGEYLSKSIFGRCKWNFPAFPSTLFFTVKIFKVRGCARTRGGNTPSRTVWQKHCLYECTERHIVKLLLIFKWRILTRCKVSLSYRVTGLKRPDKSRPLN